MTVDTFNTYVDMEQGFREMMIQRYATHMRIHTHTLTHTCTHLHIHTHTHTHTYTHTRTNTNPHTPIHTYGQVTVDTFNKYVDMELGIRKMMIICKDVLHTRTRTHTRTYSLSLSLSLSLMHTLTRTNTNPHTPIHTYGQVTVDTFNTYVDTEPGFREMTIICKDMLGQRVANAKVIFSSESGAHPDMGDSRWA